MYLQVRVEEYSNVKTQLSTTLQKQEQLETVLGSQGKGHPLSHQ